MITFVTTLYITYIFTFHSGNSLGNSQGDSQAASLLVGDCSSHDHSSIYITDTTTLSMYVYSNYVVSVGIAIILL